jgi:hypothetical protein
MTRTPLTRIAALTAVICLPFLAACSGSDDMTAAESATATARAKATASVAAGDHEDLAMFVEDFKANTTKLSKGRTDTQISGYASDVCGYLADPKVKHNTMVTRLSATMTNNGVRPNDAAVKKVAEMAVKDVCPERKADLQRVF